MATPSGTVALDINGNTPLGTITLDGNGHGSAVITATSSWSVGTWPCNASYSGDSNFNPGTGSATIVVNQSGSGKSNVTVTLTLTPTTINQGDPVTFDVTVASA